MDHEQKVRENKLRRVAARRGLRLEKSRRRDPNAIDYNGFMLVDAYSNVVKAGAFQHQFDMSIDEVEEQLENGLSGQFPKENAL